MICVAGNVCSPVMGFHCSNSLFTAFLLKAINHPQKWLLWFGGVFFSFFFFPLVDSIVRRQWFRTECAQPISCGLEKLRPRYWIGRNKKKNSSNAWKYALKHGFWNSENSSVVRHYSWRDLNKRLLILNGEPMIDQRDSIDVWLGEPVCFIGTTYGSLDKRLFTGVHVTQGPLHHRMCTQQGKLEFSSSLYDLKADQQVRVSLLGSLANLSL